MRLSPAFTIQVMGTFLTCICVLLIMGITLGMIGMFTSSVPLCIMSVCIFKTAGCSFVLSIIVRFILNRFTRSLSLFEVLTHNEHGRFPDTIRDTLE